MKWIRLSRATVISLIAITALLAGGLMYAKATGSLNVSGMAYGCYSGPIAWAVSNDDGSPTNVGGYNPIDLGDTGNLGSGTVYSYWGGNQSSNDPYAPQSPGVPCARYTKDVGKTTITSISSDRTILAVEVDNAYPLYDPTIFFGLQNTQCTPSIISSITINAPSVFTVSLHGISIGSTIQPGATATGWFDILVASESTIQQHPYTITMTVGWDNPSIAVCKTASPTSVSAPGNVTYTYKVTNTGNVTLSPVTLNDNLIGSITLPVSNLAPGASTTVTATYAITQAMIDAGTSIVNTATATGTPPTGPNVTDTDNATVTIEQGPSPGLAAITVTKTPSLTIVSAAGAVITYTYKVTNTDNVTLNPVTVTDNKLGTITLLATSLAPGASTTGTATYTVKQSDINAGSPITNIATATGKPPKGNNVTATATATVTIQVPSIAVTKTANPTSVSAAGMVTYTYKVTNTGTVTLNPVTLTDDHITGNITLGATSLAPGASTTGTATYTVTQAMIDAGTSIVNTATVTGKPPTGSNVTATAKATVTICQNPSIDVTKTANPTSVSAAGTVITYTYKVTNTGDVTLNPVTVTDNKLGTITLNATSLAPGASTTGTATYSVKQSDISACSPITNTATATGTPPTGSKVTDTATATVTIQVPSIAVTKTANPTTVSAPGTVTYTYKVTNTGTVTLNPVTLTDDHITGNITLGATSLAPGASTTGTATYTVTQAMVDAGTSITNTATVTGKPPTGAVVTATAKATVTVTQSPSITVTKTANPTSVSAPGTVTYTYKVTNTGKVTLNPVTLNDNLIGKITLPVSSLAPGASTTITATYNITQCMIDAGSSITNTATATGTPPAGTKYNVTATAQATVTISAPSPGITVTKTASTTLVSAPGTITYTYKVTNTGNVTLSPVTLNDNLIGKITLPVSSLAPGASTTGTATYTITQCMIKAGTPITNTATATGTPPAGTKYNVTATAQATVTIKLK